MQRFLLCLVLVCVLTSTVLAQQQTPYEIALERIEDAKRTGAVELDLSALGLSELPPEIGNLTNLQYLHLFNNSLSALPPEIGNLTNLQYLSLDNTNLSTLPPEIGNLSNLQALWLYNTSLSALPPEIGSLTNLQELYLNDNQFTQIPLIVFRLPNLHTFTFEGNPVFDTWDDTDLAAICTDNGTINIQMLYTYGFRKRQFTLLSIFVFIGFGCFLFGSLWLWSRLIDLRRMLEASG